MISRFGYKVMSFRDLSKLLVIAPKSSRCNPQHLETFFFHTKIIHVHKVAMKISWPLCVFWLTGHYIFWKNNNCFTILSLYIDIYFFEVNTKYISSSVLKTSNCSRVRSTSYQFWCFQLGRWNIFGIYRKKMQFYFCFILFIGYMHTKNSKPK